MKLKRSQVRMFVLLFLLVILIDLIALNEGIYGWKLTVVTGVFCLVLGWMVFRKRFNS